MTTHWEPPHRMPEERVEALFKFKTRWLLWRHQFDLILTTLLASVVVICVVAWFCGVLVSNRLGWFDPPLVQRLVDERILLNVRDGLSAHPLLDAVLHKPDGHVYISQQGGTIHRYNPATRLWTSETPFAMTSLIQPDFTRLRSGCGSDPLSASSNNCPDPDSLWALSASGGLARRSTQGWEILVGDSSFIGANGIPIENEALTAAAVSGDGRWLVVGTRNDGIGIYDLRYHAWFPLSASLFKQLSALSITHIVWAQNRFWIGGPRGLDLLELQSGTPRLSALPSIRGKVLDLDVDSDETVWILQHKNCAEGGNNCLWLGKLSRSQQLPQVLMDQLNVYDKLNLSDLFFAQYWKEQNWVVVAGKAGIYAYDMTRHNWERLFEKSVTTALPREGNSGFYFGFTDGAGWVFKDSIQIRNLGERIVQVTDGATGEIFAISDKGNVFGITVAGPVTPTLVFQQPQITDLEPNKFVSAVAISDTVLFVGTEGALLHNTVTRTYEKIPNTSLPSWLQDAGLQLVNAGDYVYALISKRTGQNSWYLLPSDKIIDSSYYGRPINSVSSDPLPGFVRQVWKWDNQSIGLLTEDDIPYRLTPQGPPNSLIGTPARDMDRMPLLDVAAVGQDLIVLTSSGLWRYDSVSRGWSKGASLPAGLRPVEIASWGSQLVVRTDKGQLVQGEEGAKSLIGDESGFRINDSGISDARRAGSQLYLAGEGRVERYDLENRRITGRWSVGGKGSVEIKGILNNQPLVLVQNQAVWGETLLDSTAGSVSSLSLTNQSIWTVREDRQRRYLKGYPIASGITASGATCFFRNPVAEGASQILDARSLPNGMIAVLTNAGLRFYNPAKRSWIAGTSNPMSAGGRLYLIGDQIVFTQEANKAVHISFLPINSLRWPDPCSVETLSLQPRTFTAAAIAVDEQAGRLAWIQPDGSVTEWRSGQEREILPPTRRGPSQTELRRFYGRGTYLWFTTDDAIWRYDLSRRQWNKLALLDLPNEPIEDMNIELQNNRETAVIHTRSGNFYLGSFTATDFSVRFKRIFSDAAPIFNAPADMLQDVQDRGDGLWTFVLQDRTKYYDPAQGKWLADSLGAHESIGSTRPPALDAGWLRWDRQQMSWIVSTGAGSVTLKKDEFIVDSRLLFEIADAVLAESLDRVHIASRYGVFTFNQFQQGWKDRSISFKPVKLAPPIVAAHGRFRTQQGDLVLGASDLRSPDGVLQFRSGDVTFSEKPLERSVDISVSIRGVTVPAFVDGTYLWDSNRRGLAYTSAGLLLQSDAGIARLEQLSGFDPGPNGLARTTGQLRSDAGSPLLVLDNGAWYRQEATGWSMADDPTVNRTLVSDNSWTWTLQNAQLRINLAGTPYGFAYSFSREGFGFNSDRLQAASAFGNQLYVMTEAFMEFAIQPEEVGSMKAARSAPLSSDRLDTVAFADGSAGLFRHSGSMVEQWDSSLHKFMPMNASGNPYLQRLLVETERLRLTARSGSVTKEFKLDSLQGQSAWITFNFRDGQFPFDKVTSLATLGNQLFVGTAAGLQVYGPTLSFGLKDMMRLLDPQSQMGTSVAGILRVGSPPQAPLLLMARSTGACIESRDGKSFAPCRDATILDTRLRARTDLWEWTAGPSGETNGQYRDNLGQATVETATLAGGRFPHDQFKDVSICDGRAFSLWKNGWVTVYPDATLRLAAGVQNFSFSDRTSTRFVCIPRDIPLVGSTLTRGIYLEGGNRRMRRFTGTGWVEVTDAEVVTALTARADQPPILDRVNLRLLSRAGSTGFTFEQRSLSGQWVPLPWKSGRVAVDQWTQILFDTNRLWAATSVGLVSFERDASGRAVLNPNAFLVVREPTDTKGTCSITDLRVENEQVIARCNSDSTKIYAATSLDGTRDKGIFQPSGVDPFAEHKWVDAETNGIWKWQLTGRKDGNPGRLVTKLNDEEVELAGGRFAFDTVTSLVFFAPNLLDMATSMGGWYQSPRGRLDPLELKRPLAQVDSTKIVHVGIGEGSSLCLRSEKNELTRRDAKGMETHPQECLEDLGDDGLWRYLQSEGSGLHITAHANSTGGAGTRKLQAGRFTDDIVIGLPVATRNNGRIVYWVPTSAGILRLDGDFTRRQIHVAQFPGLAPDSVPSSVFALDSETTTYAAAGALYRLDKTRAQVVDLLLRLPEKTEIQAIEDGPYDYIRVLWQSGERRSWTLVDREDSRIQVSNALQINMSHLDAFQTHRVEWGDPDPWLLLQFEPNACLFSHVRGTRPLRLNLPTNFQPRKPILLSDRLLLIGSQELLDISFSGVLGRIMEQPANPGEINVDLPLISEPVATPVRPPETAPRGATTPTQAPTPTLSPAVTFTATAISPAVPSTRTPTVTLTATRIPPRTPTPAPALLTNSATDFSLGQGNKGWSYYSFEGGLRPLSPATAGKVEVCGGKDCWVGNPPWIRLDAAGGHPGENGVAVIRSWKSNVTGRLSVILRARKIDVGGDGVSITMQLNDQIKWGPKPLDGNDTVGFKEQPIELNVRAGDDLRFVIYPNRRPENDYTYFVVEIWLVGR